MVPCGSALLRSTPQCIIQVACEEDTWIGAPISPPLAVELAERNGFELLRSEGAEEQYFWLWYFKPSRLQMWRKAAEADGCSEGMRRRVR